MDRGQPERHRSYQPHRIGDRGGSGATVCDGLRISVIAASDYAAMACGLNAFAVAAQETFSSARMS